LYTVSGCKASYTVFGLFQGVIEQNNIGGCSDLTRFQKAGPAGLAHSDSDSGRFGQSKSKQPLFLRQSCPLLFPASTLLSENKQINGYALFKLWER
jgi:hypothetical protein